MRTMTKPTLAVIVGSVRRESLNRKLAQGIGKLAAGQFDVKFIQIDDLPIYNQDLETAPPAAVTSRAKSARPTRSSSSPPNTIARFPRC
jgi:NAD(P)H-dependent FMN reductase